MKLAPAMIVAALIAAPATADVNVGIDQSDAPWLGFMNVFELDSNGGGFVFGSGWGVPDLSVSFDDGASSMTFGPNTIGDPNEFWYQDPTGSGNANPGGPGAPGNKSMEANLFQQLSDGSLSGTTVNFSGSILSDTLTSAHVASVFIRDFAEDFSSVNETIVALDASGSFDISLATIDDGTARNVQWGIQLKGENVWITDVAPFGNITFATVPAPGAMALLGLGGIVAGRRRR
ncbi:MAG: PEP-CTERM sorting domain-containing protein [Phycisphaerales bacterium]